MLQPLETPRGFVPSLHADEFPELYRAADNPRRPIALLFCCYGGTLDAPTRGLAEELLLRSEGPVAVLAASRTTMPYGMGVYGVELLQELSRQQNTAEPLTLGRLSFAAKHNMLRPQSNSHAEAVNHANASHTIAMKTTRQRVRHRPLRENLETLARMFDPTALQLSVQLEEHAALFHLFGDPLLRLPKPKPIWLECPEKAKPGETLFISGQIGRTDHRDSVDETAFRGNVLVEWVLAPQRISLSSARRSEIRLDEETRRRDNAEYSAANNRVLFRTNAVVETGRFNATLTVPTDARGRYVVRVFALNETENDYALGAASVDIGRGN